MYLISPRCKISPSEFSKKIFDSFYKANSNDELFNLIDEILVKNNDNKLEARLKALNDSNLLHNDAASNILSEICKDLKINIFSSKECCYL